MSNYFSYIPQFFKKLYFMNNEVKEINQPVVQQYLQPGQRSPISIKQSEKKVEEEKLEKTFQI